MSGELEQILLDEGFSSEPYLDHLFNWTIGHGLTNITERESTAVVGMRLEDLEEQIKGHLHWFPALPEEIRNVLLNMAYQLGVAGLMGFSKTLAYINKGKFVDASEEMLDSKWARQTPNRAKRLSDRLRAVSGDTMVL